MGAVQTNKKYETVIGLEIHVELLTESKIWCGCSTRFGNEPNTQVCPVCLGLPGALPVLNERAIEFAVKAGLAMDCTISRWTKFDRKHYFYPDLPKAFQTSQDDRPLCENGEVHFKWKDEWRQVGITRVHLEEEAGKSLHSGDNILGSEFTLVDYNRSGVPLIEIVTEPDIRSPEEARLFLETLRTLLLYTEISDCKMQEGSLRCDANISLRPVGATQFGDRAEIKNLNSFRAIQRALEYEEERQSALLDAGEKVVQETRHWNEQRGVTISMRSKEEAEEYRYMPDPDLLPVTLTDAQINEWNDQLPELPQEKEKRFIEQYDLPSYDAGVLTTSPAVADFFEAVAKESADAKLASNWVMGELLRILNDEGIEIGETSIKPKDLADLIVLVKKGVISNNVGKEVFEKVFNTGRSAMDIVKEEGLEQISDEGELEGFVDRAIEENPGPADDVRQGKDKAIGFLVGQVMRLSQGKANPQRVNELLRSRLK